MPRMLALRITVRVARAWQSTSISLAVLDVLVIAALVLLLGWRFDVRPSSHQRVASTPASESGPVPVHRPPSAVAGSRVAAARAPNLVYLVGSQPHALELSRVLGAWEMPARTRDGGISFSYDIIVLSTAADEVHLRKLLFAGEHPRPELEVVDLRERKPGRQPSGVYQLTAE